MKVTKNSSIYKFFTSGVLVVIFFAILTLLYFKPLLENKTLQQGDISQWIGMSQELREFAETNPGVKAAWSGSMFSGMPSYHFGSAGYDTPNYLSYIQDPISLFDTGGKGPVFAGLLCAYLLFFLLTGNIWIAILGAIAFALSSYNIIIIQAGHVTKAWAIAYIPLVLSGLLLVFKKKNLLGGGVFALGLGLELIAGHVQITYYLAIFCLILFVGYAIHCIVRKEIKILSKAVLTLVIGLIFAALPRVSGLYTDLLMGKESLRGPSELTSTSPGQSKPSTGLDIDYAFAWSYGKGETISLMIPDIRGGASGGTLGKDSHLYKELKQNGQRPGNDIQSYTYWGDQPFTSGPVYFGAVVCFLFVLGMFVIKNNAKWWLLGAAVCFVFLSWGNNMAWFNDFLFHYLPMYNKFRTPSMSLVIPAVIFPLVACWGLKCIVDHQIETDKLKKSLLYSLGISGGICLILWVFPGVFYSFQSANDAQFVSQVPDWYYSALLADRESLLKADAFRSLIFILLAAGSIWLLIKKDRKRLKYSLIILAILVLVDLWMVDKRYLNDSHFVRKQQEKIFEPTAADKIILEDKSPSYRVLNISTNTFNEATTSYFHKSIGGYNAAKLRRYQELIDHRISKEIQVIGKSFQSATRLEDIYQVFQATPTLNMLNAKYIIYNPGQAPVVNPNVNGNAWFVHDIQWADNADQELGALDIIDPLATAVIDKKFADLVDKSPLLADTTASIKLLEYQPAYLKYETTVATGQLAVFSEIYFKDGWKAFIDGQPAVHFRADWILRAMNIPDGKHIVEFRFEPDTHDRLLAVGSVASLLLVIAVAGIIIYTGVGGFISKK